jgi:hypothetical protein
VFEDELVHLEAEDRAYVAAETTAFLLAWLTALPCRVVNRPSPLSLLGPRWRREEWVRAAVHLGIPAVPTRRSVGTVEEPGPEDGARPAPAVVVGDGWFGDVAPELGERALRLARHAGVDLLEAWFDDPEERGRLLDATPAATLRDPAVVDAVRDLFPPEPSP